MCVRACVCVCDSSFHTFKFFLNTLIIGFHLICCSFCSSSSRWSSNRMVRIVILCCYQEFLCKAGLAVLQFLPITSLFDIEFLSPPESMRQTDESVRDFELCALLAWGNCLFKLDIFVILWKGLAKSHQAWQAGWWMAEEKRIDGEKWRPLSPQKSNSVGVGKNKN